VIRFGAGSDSCQTQRGALGASTRS